MPRRSSSAPSRRPALVTRSLPEDLRAARHEQHPAVSEVEEGETGPRPRPGSHADTKVGPQAGERRVGRVSGCASDVDLDGALVENTRESRSTEDQRRPRVAPGPNASQDHERPLRDELEGPRGGARCRRTTPRRPPWPPQVRPRAFSKSAWRPALALRDLAHPFAVLTCPWCCGRRKLIALITDGKVVRAILEHLRLPTAAPVLAPARSPPELDFAG